MSNDKKNKNTDQDLKNKNTKTLITVLAVVVGMVGLAFASVPLYNLFCQVTGFGGTTQRAATAENVQAIDREITVRFDANTAPDLDWDFKAKQKSITVKVGQDSMAYYSAENTGDAPSTGTAIYNVTPLKAGQYFNKVACFCFDEQTLKPGQKVDMPVDFFIDPAIDEDPNLKDVKTITLSYTFFKAETEALDQAKEEFYNAGEE